MTFTHSKPNRKGKVRKDHRTNDTDIESNIRDILFSYDQWHDRKKDAVAMHTSSNISKHRLMIASVIEKQGVLAGN